MAEKTQHQQPITTGPPVNQGQPMAAGPGNFLLEHFIKLSTKVINRQFC